MNWNTCYQITHFRPDSHALSVSVSVIRKVTAATVTYWWHDKSDMVTNIHRSIHMYIYTLIVDMPGQGAKSMRGHEGTIWQSDFDVN